ncbi:MAG: hypothetical protein HY654_03405 [Acidobacteria bacterium]|nr:hypothetical protein [Acidobacteriota bacterium]
MKSLVVGAIILSLAVVTAAAQPFDDAQGGPKPETIKGHLIDVACGTEKDANAKTAAKHDKPCLQMDDCVKSGYGVMTAENTFYKFDNAGNQNARKLIRATDKAADWRVTVVGTISGEKIAVQTMALDK